MIGQIIGPLKITPPQEEKYVNPIEIIKTTMK